MVRSMKNEKGFTLIEVVIAMAIMGIVAAGFLMALSTASKSIILADERTTAESLARSQMEYVKEQLYSPAPDYDPGPPSGGEITYLKILNIPANYTIWSVDRYNVPVENIIYGVPWDSQNNIAVDIDVGLQKITVTIQHQGKDVITLEGYKVDR
jgi:prepilin-type N-terminal cleavage/methylation domain-containing protein